MENVSSFVTKEARDDPAKQGKASIQGHAAVPLRRHHLLMGICREAKEIQNLAQKRRVGRARCKFGNPVEHFRCGDDVC